jgi:hypothetical protein
MFCAIVTGFAIGALFGAALMRAIERHDKG